MQRATDHCPHPPVLPQTTATWFQAGLSAARLPVVLFGGASIHAMRGAIAATLVLPLANILVLSIDSNLTRAALAVATVPSAAISRRELQSAAAIELPALSSLGVSITVRVVTSSLDGAVSVPRTTTEYLRDRFITYVRECLGERLGRVPARRCLCICSRFCCHYFCGNS